MVGVAADSLFGLHWSEKVYTIAHAFKLPFLDLSVTFALLVPSLAILFSWLSRVHPLLALWLLLPRIFCCLPLLCSP